MGGIYIWICTCHPIWVWVGVGKETNQRVATKEVRKEICLSPTLWVRRDRSSFNLEIQDVFVGAILLKTLLFRSFQMLQAACKNIAMNIGLFHIVFAVLIQSNREP